VCRIGLVALAWCVDPGSAMAFPATDASNPSIVPGNADLAAPDAEDLQRQMGLASGFAALGSQQGWTILPRLTLEESFTDNVFEVNAPRSWDLTTIVAPGVSILGNSDRAQLRLDYQPNLEIHVINGSQNLLGEQLNAVGTLTAVPEWFFIDLRAVAGVQATNGGVGGLGGLGQPGTGGVAAGTQGQAQAADVALAKQNRSETSSFSISPYLLRQIGDTATVKLGVALSQSNTSPVSGFAPIPFVSQGSNDQHESTVEEFAQIESGDAFTTIRDTFTADGLQSTIGGIGVSSSVRDTASDRVDYQFNRSIDVYGQLGWEDISYSGANQLKINDLTWGVGTVLTPNPDSQLTLGYGRQNGATTLTADAHYALTARTILTASFTNGVGTQLEQVNNQLAQSGVGNNGGLVNNQTGSPVFVGNNALGIAPGIYRYKYLTVGATTVLDRDTINVIIGHSEQTQVGTGVAGTSNAVTTGSAVWTHEISPVLTTTASAAVSVGSPTAGNSQRSLVLGLSLQYILSETVTTFARYSFYDVRSDVAGQSWYQDLFLVGISKQF
jgi:uncharacterized protein (PEP-CTERM system associated)